jgi:hypothetical protein
MELVGLKGRSPAITSLGIGHIRRRREFLIDVEWCNATDIFFEPASHGDQVDITSLSSTRLSPRLELSFASGSQDVPLDRLLTLIDDAFSLTRLTTVHLAAADKKLISNECEQLFRTFARCPVLQDIHFTETPIKHFLTVLGDSEVDSSVDPGYRTPAREVFLFPALARLSFCLLDWKTAGWSVRLLSRGLAKAFNGRSLNHRLQHLRFSQCTISSPSDIESLKASLPGVVVEWEGEIDANISQHLPSAFA